jgi:hypothetical protein
VVPVVDEEWATCPMDFGFFVFIVIVGTGGDDAGGDVYHIYLLIPL